MNVILTELSGVLVIEPDIFGDARGFFMESWNGARYKEHGMPDRFVQDNLSFSAHGVLRGLHFQNPMAQGKLVSVLRGEVFDVAVDIRVGSPTFGGWTGSTLSREQAPALGPSRLRPRFRRHGRERALLLQMHRLLRSRVRPVHPVERSRDRDTVAGREPESLGQRPRRPTAEPDASRQPAAL